MIGVDGAVGDVIDGSSPAEALAAERERRVRLLSLAHPSAHEGPAAELVLAADQFVITPAGRAEDAARAHARRATKCAP